ncbi:MAG: hypothetical protein AB7P76_04385 [Candidatus Melainabacteria bacterium]
MRQIQPLSQSQSKPGDNREQELTTDSVRVSPKIVLLNHFLRQCQQVAVQSLHPIYRPAEPVYRNYHPHSTQRPVDSDVLEAFFLSVEGPPQKVRDFLRLLTEANLRLK